MIRLENVCAGYEGKYVVENISVTLADGGLVALLGPNGSGKSTLLKAMAGLLPAQGFIEYDGRSLAYLHRRERAKSISFMPQHRSEANILVKTLVEHGRYPHMGFSKRLGNQDRACVEQAVEATHIGPLLYKSIAALSGGERQRVYLAMMLAQDCPYLLLDEPMTFLDINAQLEVIEIVTSIHAQGRTVILAMHDIAQAFTYAQTVCVMHKGRLMTCAAPSTQASRNSIQAVFHVDILPCSPAEAGLYGYKLSLIEK